MPAIKYKVTLSDDEIQNLERLISKGKSASRSHTRARIMLKAAAGFQDQATLKHWTFPLQWSTKHARGVLRKGLRPH